MGVGVKRRTDESGGTGELPRTEVFDILGNDRPRYAIRYLLETGATDVGELAVQVAAREYDTEPAAVESDQRHRVYATLQQTHLPRLREADAIRYDEDRVSLTDRGATLRRYLDCERPTQAEATYVSLAAVSAVALCVVSVAPMSVPATPRLVAAGTVVAFVLAAALRIGRRAERVRARGGRLSDRPP